MSGDGPRPGQPRLVVGIGAAAGWEASLDRLFAGAAPPDAYGAIAFVLVLHVREDAGELAARVASHANGLPVALAEEGKRVEPGRLHLAPPALDLAIRDGAFRLTPPDRPPGRRHPVDFLLASLAEDQGERAAAVILSGEGTNGTAGAREVRGSGGLVLVQDPATAAHPGMARSATDQGEGDLVLPPEAMVPALAAFARRGEAASTSPEAGGTLDARDQRVLDARDQRVLDAEDQRVLDAEDQRGIDSVLTLLRAQGGRDFRSYRRSTLARRVGRRMGLADTGSVAGYLELLRGDPGEVKALAGDLMIGVTGFFRDREAWLELASLAIDPIVARRGDGEPVRAWVPGCSSGEEAYSLAMLLAERAEAAGKHLDVQIFATDVAGDRLARARRGLYPSSVAADVGPVRLARFFDDADADDRHRLRRPIREAVTFAPHNLLADPPFSRLDLISCRNLLIYLEANVQDNLLTLFHLAIRPGGHLFLGSAETLGRRGDLFEPLSKRWRVYRRLAAARPEPVAFPIVATPRTVTAALPPPQPERRPDDAPRRLVQQALAERFAPAAALVDRGMRVLYLHGPTDDYLRQPAGEPTRDLATMARDGLSSGLRTVVRRATAGGGRAAVHARVNRGAGGPAAAVRVTAFPLPGDDPADGRLLVTFEPDHGHGHGPSPSAGAPGERGRAAAAEAAGTVPEREAEDELRRVRAELEGSIEELATSNEELQAGNEEMASVNEELQAGNEELEATKEELQALNEELTTVNGQLQAKLDELEQSRDDLDNLLDSTRIATLALDPQFRIRWFTPSVGRLLDIVPSDIGRPVDSFAPRFRGPDLLRDASAVLRSLVPIERDVTGEDGRCYARRVLPYRTRGDRIAGVVVTFDDVTERRAEERRRRFAGELNLITRPLADPDQLLRAVTRIAADHLAAGRAVYSEVDEEDRIIPLHQQGGRAADASLPPVRPLASLGPTAAATLRRGELLVVEDVGADPRTAAAAPVLEAAATRSLLAVPLLRDGRLVGLLELHGAQPRPWSAAEVRPARVVAERTWLAIEQARADRAREEARQLTEAVVDTVREALVVLDPDLKVVSANRAFHRVFEAFIAPAAPATRERPAPELDVRAWGLPGLVARLEEMQRGGPPLDDLEVERDVPGSDRRIVSMSARSLRGQEGGRAGLVLLAIADVTERRRAERERELLLKELRHRLKNSLAVVRAVAAMTLRPHGLPDSAWDAFAGRLEALSLAQDLVGRGDWGEVRLLEVLEEQIAPFRTGDNIDLAGPDDVLLASRLALSLSLAVHELATNATKYGALSAAGGRVDVTWRVDAPHADGGGRVLALRWAESGGPHAATPGRRGFGHEMIERMLAYEAGGEARLEFAAEGVRCHIELPLADPAGAGAPAPASSPW